MMIDMANLNLGMILSDYVIPYGTKILLCVALLIVGWLVIKVVVNGIDRLFNSSNLDPTIRSVAVSSIAAILKVMLLLAVVSTLGVETTSFVAVFGALSLAAGMAFQGSLGNLAGGLLILFFRPFKIGDFIKAQGESGFVKEIQLFVTVLETPDKETIYLPNGALSAGKITNVTEQGNLRLHIPVGIDYSADIRTARKVLLEVMQNNDKVLLNPAPQVAVTNLGDSSVDLDLRPWCNPGDAPAVQVQILEAAKEALDKANIGIPYPHQVVYMSNQN